jgi:hypothetical protein
MPIRKGRLARLSVFEHRFSEEKVSGPWKQWF